MEIFPIYFSRFLINIYVLFDCSEDMEEGNYIVSIDFHIVSEDAEKKPIARYSGFMVRTFLYKFLQRTLGFRDMHSEKGLKMYSVTPLYNRDSSGRLHIYRRGEVIERAHFRVNLLSVGDPHIILGKLGLLDRIEVDTHRFRVMDLNLTINSYKSLVENASPIEKFRMSFLTPTSLRSPSQYIAVRYDGEQYVSSIRSKSRSKAIYVPLPYPELIFKNLLRMFRSFSGISDLPYEEIRNFIADDGVTLSGFPKGIRTVSLRPGPGETYIGFIGTVYMTCRDSSSEMARYIDALLRFSEYSNVGVARTAGLGWVEAMESK